MFWPFTPAVQSFHTDCFKSADSKVCFGGWQYAQVYVPMQYVFTIVVIGERTENGFTMLAMRVGELSFI